VAAGGCASRTVVVGMMDGLLARWRGLGGLAG
jgi:hypothetical protein